MNGSAEHRLVVCILPAGLAAELRLRLFDELEVTRVDVYTARGFIGADPAGLFNRVEKEILTVVVEAERSNDLFEWIYHQGEVADFEGRFLYEARLEDATPFHLPEEVPVEADG